MAKFADNYLAGGKKTDFDYCVDMRIVDINNGEEFLMLDVLVLVPELQYGLFVMNKPVAINKWMILLTPERGEREEDGDMSTEYKAFAFETSMNCKKIPAATAIKWLKKAMLKKKSMLITTSRPLICYISNIFYSEGKNLVPLDNPFTCECCCICNHW